MLVAELAASARRAIEELAEPAERCVRLQEFLLSLARVRRQDNLAGKLALEHERRAREHVEKMENDEYRKECAREWEPMRRQFKRAEMTDDYGKPDFTSQLMATHQAESLLRGIKLDGSNPAGSTAPVKPESN